LEIGLNAIMSLKMYRFFIMTTLVAINVLGCSSQDAPTATNAATTATPPMANPQAAKELAMYQELLRSQNDELAAPIGQEIVQKFPGSAAAIEVQQTLADVTNRAQASSEKRRLERLWSYQSGQESGGTQNTASIYSAEPNSEAERVRLVLRRHSAWGQSVYLFGNGKGFDCGKACTLTLSFDDQAPSRVKASLPPTGEPAIFIEDDRAFIAKLEKARTLVVNVTLKGRGSQTLKFEIGGYSPSKFPPSVAGGKQAKRA